MHVEHKVCLEQQVGLGLHDILCQAMSLTPLSEMLLDTHTLDIILSIYIVLFLLVIEENQLRTFTLATLLSLFNGNLLQQLKCMF